jgi:hypothetical protein
MERDERMVEREAEAAAREAGEIGGRVDAEDGTEAERPLAEAGEGVAEGFEQSEEQLRNRAEHRDAGGNPWYDRADPEPDDPEASYSEADHEHSSEGEEDR